jgi:hypothetical protein
VVEFKKPVMLYSIGKDIRVLLQVAVKAFHPAKLPFPLMHLDTNLEVSRLHRQVAGKTAVMADIIFIFILGFGYGYAVQHWISLQRSFVFLERPT